jgi:hypothetical protein
MAFGDFLGTYVQLSLVLGNSAHRFDRVHNQIEDHLLQLNFVP